MSAGPAERARSHFEAGEFGRCREVAREGLAAEPDDVELLRLSGRAGVELGAEDAIDQLRRVVELQPDADSWRDLGDALATEGHSEEANQAFEKVLELNPEDEVALTHLGHLAYASGKGEEAVSYLSAAAGRAPRASTAAISLVDMYRTMGQPQDALAAARKLADAAPDDVLAGLDVAELSLTLGQLDEAADAFMRIRNIEDVPGREIYPLHGLIEVELRRGDFSRALDRAREAAADDNYGRTARVLAFLQAEVEGPGEDPVPAREEVDALLTASLAEYRRLLAEDRGLGTEVELG